MRAGIIAPDAKTAEYLSGRLYAPKAKYWYILGTPDIIVEVLSKGTRNVDRGTKTQLYKKFQVPEYWIVDPVGQTVEIYVYRDGDYELVSSAEESGEVSSVVLDGFKLEVSAIFE